MVTFEYSALILKLVGDKFLKKLGADRHSYESLNFFTLIYVN